MQENRKFHRYLLSIEIVYSKEHADNLTTSMAKNVSEGGVCITTTAGPLELYGIYILKFILPEDGEPVEIKARVVWSRVDNTQENKLFDNGLEFMDIEEKHRAAIEKYSIGAVLEK